MKVDSHLTLVRGEANTTRCQTSPSVRSSPEARPPFRDLLVLVSQENQRARELLPQTVEEAHRLLTHFLSTVKDGPPEVLSDIHRVQAAYMVRLL